jgi:hypothetical protein
MFRNSRPAVSGTLRLYDFERFPSYPAISCERKTPKEPAALRAA